MSSTLVTKPAPAQVALGECDRLRPPRVNPAGVCVCCGERGCEAARCLEWYERAAWMVCPECDGQLWRESAYGSDPCGCIFGVVEAGPVRVDGWRVEVEGD